VGLGPRGKGYHLLGPEGIREGQKLAGFRILPHLRNRRRALGRLRFSVAHNPAFGDDQRIGTLLEIGCASANAEAKRYQSAQAPTRN
jgi:hypothetical protein